MNKILLVIFCWILSLNLAGSEVNKFEDYFNSEVKFQVFEDYRNVFSSTVPIRFYRSETNEYLEFVGVYELEAYDEIYNNFFKLFESKGILQGDFLVSLTAKRESEEVWFENSKEKGMIKTFKGKLWVKYLKKRN